MKNKKSMKILHSPGKTRGNHVKSPVGKHVAAPLQAHPYVYETREAATAACQSIGYRGLCGKSQVKGAWQGLPSP